MELEFNFNLFYDDKVLKEDLSKISKKDKNKIKEKIEKKLAFDPVFYGKPLHFSLRGLRKLKVEKYRVVFFIKKKNVYIIYIGHRSKTYKNNKRLKINL